MDKKSFVPLMNYLFTAYRQEVVKKEMSVYYESLGIYESKTVLEAMKRWVNQSPFFPRIADLLKMIRESVISYESVMSELYSVIKLMPGESFKSESLHPVSAQLLRELGGKHRISGYSDDELRKQVRMKYKYVINDQMLGLNGGSSVEIGKRTGQKTLGEAIELPQVS